MKTNLLGNGDMPVTEMVGGGMGSLFLVVTEQSDVRLSAHASRYNNNTSSLFWKIMIHKLLARLNHYVSAVSLN